MKIIIILLLGATVFWLWRGGAGPAGENVSPENTPEIVASKEDALKIIGRWRNDRGENIALRDNGQFTASRRLSENHTALEVNFIAGVRGGWKKEGNLLLLTVDKVEGVTVQGVRVVDRTLFASTSEADTRANQLRSEFPGQYAASGKGAVFSLEIQNGSARALQLKEGGQTRQWIRVE